VLPQYSEPSIVSSPLENIILNLKLVGITEIATFPFPTRPPLEHIKRAIARLLELQALYWPSSENTEAKAEPEISELGKILA